MRYQESTFCREGAYTLHNHMPDIDEDRVIGDLLKGLTCSRKYISCVYFYDAKGSKLFEKITRLPEYYLTRLEKDLLREAALELGSTLHDTDIIEFGSGDCSKISILFDAVPPDDMGSIRYVPVDVSRSAVEESADILVDLFPGLAIHGIIADFERRFSCIPEGTGRLFCFLGSTIGNFSNGRAVKFLSDLREVMRPDDMLLVGFDMVKEKEIIERAYNDSSLVTAEFNKNILNVVNALAGTNFTPDTFEHVAFYNGIDSRIEMHLRALEDLVISCPHVPDGIRIVRGETIHTENSHKYTTERMEELVSRAGLKVQTRYTDGDEWYSLALLRTME
jgi:L-histidine N-alpha-methyltransferase